MQSKLKDILIICYANYCRSPAAERILSSLNNQGDYFIFSRGLNPMTIVDMDNRTKKFLRDKSIDAEGHTPLPVTKKDISEADLIIALDFSIYNHLAQKYDFNKSKMILMNEFDPFITTEDPFKKSSEEYSQVMENIFTLSKSLSDRLKSLIK